MAPLSRRSAPLGDSDLEAPLNPPLNPSPVKHNSVSAHGSTVRDGETQMKWHDGIAGGVVSLYSVMAYTLLTVTTFTISLPTCRQAITSLGGTPRLSGAVMGFMPLASGFAQLPLLLVLKRVPLRTVLLTFCVVLCASEVCCALPPVARVGWATLRLPLCLPPSHLRCQYIGYGLAGWLNSPTPRPSLLPITPGGVRPGGVARLPGGAAGISRHLRAGELATA